MSKGVFILIWWWAGTDLPTNHVPYPFASKAECQQAAADIDAATYSRTKHVCVFSNVEIGQ